MFDNRLELVIDVDATKGNAAIKGVNANLSDLEQTATVTARQWGSGMDRMGSDAARSMGRSRQEMRQASDAARLLGNQIGIELPRSVIRFIGQSQVLGTVLSTLFKFSIYLAAGEALVSWVTRIGEKFGWWGDKAKKTKDDMDALTKSIQEQTKELAQLQKQRELIGLTGIARLEVESIQRGREAEKITRELVNLEEIRQRLAKQATETWEVARGFGGAHIMTVEPTKAALEARKVLAMTDAQILALQASLRTIETERINIATEIAAAKRDEAKATAEQLAKERAAAEKAAIEIHKQTAARAAQALETGRVTWMGISQETADAQAGLAQDAERALIARMEKEWAQRSALEEKLRDTAIEARQIVMDQQRQQFESLKRSAEGVFDALLTRSQSVFSAIGNLFKTAMLTAIKEIVSSQVARMLMQLFGGGRISLGGGAGGGILGTAGAALPLLGAGGGAGGVRGWLKNASGLGSLFGGAGATGTAAMLTAPTLTGFGGPMVGGTIGSLLVPTGGAAAIGTATAVGGTSFLGSMGAFLTNPWTIGIAAAAIGAFALYKIFHKSAQDKAREKIRATYGVDIRDKGVLRQIVEMAKQGFGGNLDMAIRSQQIRDLVELYAMTTGQSTKGLPAKMMPVSLMQTGGSLYQQSGGITSALPGAAIGAGTAANAGPISFTINLSPEAAQNLLTKGVVEIMNANPRVTQSASMRATKQNFSRRELTSLQLSPGTLTS